MKNELKCNNVTKEKGCGKYGVDLYANRSRA